MNRTWIAAFLWLLLVLEARTAPDPDPQTYQRRHHTKEEKIEETYSNPPNSEQTHSSYFQPTSSFNSDPYGSGKYSLHYSDLSDSAKYGQQDIYNDQFNNFQKHFQQPQQQGSYSSYSSYSSYGQPQIFQDHGVHESSVQQNQHFRKTEVNGKYSNAHMQTLQEPQDSAGQKYMKLIYSSNQQPSSIVTTGNSPFKASETVEKSIITSASSGSYGRQVPVYPEHGVNILENQGFDYKRKESNSPKIDNGWVFPKPEEVNPASTIRHNGYQRTVTEERKSVGVEDFHPPQFPEPSRNHEPVNWQKYEQPSEANPSSWVSGSYTYHQVKPADTTKQFESASLKHYNSFNQQEFGQQEHVPFEIPSTGSKKATSSHEVQEHDGNHEEFGQQEYVPPFHIPTSVGSKKKTVSSASSQYHEVHVQNADLEGTTGSQVINDKFPGQPDVVKANQNVQEFQGIGVDAETPNLYNSPYSRKSVSEFHHETQEVHHTGIQQHNTETPIYNSQFNKLLGSIESLKREQENASKFSVDSPTYQLPDAPRRPVNSFDIRTSDVGGFVNEPVENSKTTEPSIDFPDGIGQQVDVDQRKTKVSIRKESHNKTETYESSYSGNNDARQTVELAQVPEKLKIEPRDSGFVQKDFMSSQFGQERNIERLEKLASRPSYNEGSFARSTVRKSGSLTNVYPDADGKTTFSNVNTGGENKIYWSSTGGGSTGQYSTFEQMKAQQEFELKQKLEEMKEKMVNEMKRKIEAGEITGGQVYVMHGGSGNGGIEEHSQHYVKPTTHENTQTIESSNSQVRSYPFYADPDCEYSKSAGLHDLHQMNGHSSQKSSKMTQSFTESERKYTNLDHFDESRRLRDKRQVNKVKKSNIFDKDFDEYQENLIDNDDDVSYHSGKSKEYEADHGLYKELKSHKGESDLREIKGFRKLFNKNSRTQSADTYGQQHPSEFAFNQAED